MNRHDDSGAQPAGGNERFVDVHVGAAADGNKGDVGFINFADQLKVLLQRRVTEVINFDAAEIEKNAGGLSERLAVGQKTAVHGIAELCRSPWILPCAADGNHNGLRTLLGAVNRKFGNGGNRSLIVFGNFDGIAEMILMPVREKNIRSPDVRRFFDGGRRSGQKGVDNNIDEVLNTTEAISNILYYYINGDNNE